MATKDRSNYFIIAAVFLLILVVYRIKTKGGLFSEVPPPEPAPSHSTQVSPQIIAETDVNRARGQEQDRKRKLLAAKEQLGMQSMPLRVTKGSYELPFELAVKPLWCKAGEYEAILGLVRELDEKIFLVSVESANSPRPLAKPLRVSLSDLSKGFRHVFKLKSVNANTNDNVNVVICTDRAKRGYCSEYKAADYPKLEAIQQKKPNSPLKDDYIYIYHNLFLKNGELVSYGYMDYSKAYKGKVESMLKKENFALSAFDKTWGISETTRSEPSTMVLGKFTAYMSRNNPKCRMR